MTDDFDLNEEILEEYEIEKKKTVKPDVINRKEKPDDIYENVDDPELEF